MKLIEERITKDVYKAIILSVETIISTKVDQKFDNTANILRNDFSQNLQRVQNRMEAEIQKLRFEIVTSKTIQDAHLNTMME